jgi:excisionase family DNA binding protein
MGNREQWVSIAELAAELGVPPATVYQWRSQGQGPRGGRFGKHVRFRRVDVDAWIAARMDDGAAA